MTSRLGQTSWATIHLAQWAVTRVTKVWRQQYFTWHQWGAHPVSHGSSEGHIQFGSSEGHIQILQVLHLPERSSAIIYYFQFTANSKIYSLQNNLLNFLWFTLQATSNYVCVWFACNHWLTSMLCGNCIESHSRCFCYHRTLAGDQVTTNLLCQQIKWTRKPKWMRSPNFFICVNVSHNLIIPTISSLSTSLLHNRQCLLSRHNELPSTHFTRSARDQFQ